MTAEKWLPIKTPFLNQSFVQSVALHFPHNQALKRNRCCAAPRLVQRYMAGTTRRAIQLLPLI